MVVLSQCFYDRAVEVDSGSTLSRISCYTPQTSFPYNEKDNFLDQLNIHLWKNVVAEHILIGGNLNCQVGLTQQGYVQCHGG